MEPCDQGGFCGYMQVGQIYQKFECKDRSDGGIVRNVVRWSIENLLEVTILWPLYLWGCSVFSFPMPEDSHFFPSISLISFLPYFFILAAQLLMYLNAWTLEYIKSMTVGGVLFAPYDHKMLTGFIFSLIRSFFLSESG